MSLPSRHPSSAGHSALRPWSGRAWWALTAVVAIASAVVSVRAVPRWADLGVCGAGVTFLAASVVKRFARRRGGPPVLAVPHALPRAAESIPDEVDWEVAPDGRMTHLDDRAVQPFGGAPRRRRGGASRRGIISCIHAEPAQRALAGALISYAHEVGAMVVAEGVETDEELGTLSGIGVDAVQGYLLGHPTEEPAVWSGWQPTRGVMSLRGVPSPRRAHEESALQR